MRAPQPCHDLPAPVLPVLLSREEASASVAAFVGEFADHVIERIERGETSALVFLLKSTVGTGKTRSLTTTLPRIMKVLPKGKAIAIAEPTLKKCDELRLDLIRAGVAGPHEIVVMRGRDAEDPACDPDPETRRRPAMCGRTKAVKAIAGYVDNVAGRMCRFTFTDDDGQQQETVCPLYDGCSHVRQMDRAKYARILIVAHAALHVGQSELSEEKDRLVALIVDEDATSALITHNEIPIENVWAVPASPSAYWPYREPNPEAKLPGSAELPADLEEAATALKARYLTNLLAIKKVIEATRAPTSRTEIRPSALAAALATAHGNTGEGSVADRAKAELSFMAVFERRKSDLAGIRPDTSDETIIETVREMRIHDRFRLAGLWVRFREQIDAWSRAEPEHAAARDYCRSVIMDWTATTVTENGDPVACPALKIHYSKDMKGGVGRVPTLLLDADANEKLLSRWVAVDRTATITARFRKTVLRQVVDRTGSMASMKKEATISQIVGSAHYLVAKHRGHIKNGVRSETDDMTGETVHSSPYAVALFSTKSSVASMAELHTADTDRELLVAALDANIEKDMIVTGHQGALRGLNTWEQCAGAVVAGRIEPSVDGLENQARAIYHDDPSPLSYLPANDKGVRRLVAMPAWYRLKGDRTLATSRTGHPDERIDAVLLSIREAELRQTIGRPRPVQRPDDTLPDCEIWVLTSIPLGLDIEIDTTHEWAELATDQIDRVYAAGVIPDHGPDLAILAGMSYGALRTEMSRRRSKRDIQAPRPGQPIDRARSAYTDALGRPGALDIGERRVLRVTYYVEINGQPVARGATVLLARGETQRDAWLRATEIIARLDATVLFEGISEEDDKPDFTARLNAELAIAEAVAWWNGLEPAPATKGRWGGASPPTRH